MISGSDLWHRHAAQWQRVGHPLRPTPTDVALLQQLVRAWHADNPAAATALLLGVTPEIASMRWPSGISLVSCDHARDMILRQWPGNSAQRVAACADWNALPLRPASLGLVVGDGALNMMPSAAAYPAILRGLSDALKEDGRVLLRLFVRPDCPETPAAVMRALYDGGIGNFHIFKFRLAMAVQSAFADGVSLGSVFRAWQDAQPRARDAARACGWFDVFDEDDHPKLDAVIEYLLKEER